MAEGGNDGRRGSAEGGIPRMPWLCEACHSRESGDLETFATGRVGIGRAALGSWSPVGVGDELRGNDGGAVDSRFHGNDGYEGVAVGADDWWGGMREGRPFLRGAPPWFLGFLGVVFAGFSFCGPSGTLHRPPVWPLWPVSGLRWPVRHRRSYP